MRLAGENGSCAYRIEDGCLSVARDHVITETAINAKSTIHRAITCRQH